jgi:hypothetical protein
MMRSIAATPPDMAQDGNDDRMDGFASQFMRLEDIVLQLSHSLCPQQLIPFNDSPILKSSRFFICSVTSMAMPGLVLPFLKLNTQWKWEFHFQTFSSCFSLKCLIESLLASFYNSGLLNMLSWKHPQLMKHTSNADDIGMMYIEWWHRTPTRQLIPTVDPTYSTDGASVDLVPAMYFCRCSYWWWYVMTCTAVIVYTDRNARGAGVCTG